MTLCLMLFAFVLLAGTETFAQTISVTGTITDVTGAPMEGVSVLEKGTNNGTVSNTDGRYSLSVRSNAVLVFSFSGHKELEERVGNRSTINISLESDERELSEVVVTALGIKRNKKSLAYSTRTVEGSNLAEAREVNVANSLKGKVAGVHVNPSGGGPSGASYVVIRGSSSLTGTNQPLHVVDGVPIDNESLGRPSIFAGQRDFGDGIGNINPDDIDNVTVLKGPAAAALYGSRGAKGVILITTKKGKAGKLNVDINSNVTFDNLNVIPTRQNIYGGGYDDDYSSFDNVVIDGQSVSQWPDWLQDNWGGKYDGRMISIGAWPELGLIPYTAKSDDNFKNFFRTGSTVTNTAGVSGGSENATFRLSLSDMRNTGIIPNNSMNRQTVNLLGSFNVSPRLSAEAKVNYVRQHTVNPPETGGLSTSPVVALSRMPLFLDLDWLKNYKRADGSSINYKSGQPRNPYWLVNELLADGRRDRIIGYVLARYKFTDWLTLQARSGTDFYNDTRFSRVGVGTPGIIDGSVSNNEYSIKEENSDVLLTATGNLSKNFSGSFAVGANHLNRRTNSLGTSGSGFNIPGLYNISNAKFITAYSYPTQKQINSAYFDGQLGYKNYLFLNITGRNDWSSTLGKNNYSFFYPSTNLSFVFTDALGINSSLLSYGKLRASYAQAGADADVFRTKGGYLLSSSTFNGQPYAYISDEIPLADLKNELTRSWEFGAELNFFNNRLGVDFTYYDASTINQILPVQVSAATGYSTRIINAGEIKNRGVEIFVNAAPVVTKNFRWDMILNFSRNKSKVVSLADGIETLTLLDTYNGAVIEARVGESYGNI
ncbi:MAG: SusC/RagA family TonB-linked outer membrane protein, partial [Chitinophagaceae bacterium]|nr:SusC/RagA family TonB-linked outer membrane protein [Chitinophagaceae bacterium]